MSPLVYCTHCAGPLDEAGACRACTPTASAHVSPAEALFISYLAARIVHARQRLQAAQADACRDPHNRAKLDTIRRAEDELRRLQSQLAIETGERQRELRAAEQQRFLTEHRQATADAVAPVTGERRCPRCAGLLPGAVRACRCGYVVEPDTGPAHTLPEAAAAWATKNAKGK